MKEHEHADKSKPETKPTHGEVAINARMLKLNQN
jgi:hypothetical protein